jgi:hypothetical protein
MSTLNSTYVLGAARADRVRDRRDLRLDPHFGGFTIVDFINIFVPALDLFGGRRD